MWKGSSFLHAWSSWCDVGELPKVLKGYWKECRIQPPLLLSKYHKYHRFSFKRLYRTHLRRGKNCQVMIGNDIFGDFEQWMHMHIQWDVGHFRLLKLHNFVHKWLLEWTFFPHSTSMDAYVHIKYFTQKCTLTTTTWWNDKWWSSGWIIMIQQPQ